MRATAALLWAAMTVVSADARADEKSSPDLERNRRQPMVASERGAGLGNSRPRPTIIGGTVDEGDPAVVGVGPQENYICTGTLVAPNIVLTAAHCLELPITHAYFGPKAYNFFAERAVAECYESRYFVYPGIFMGHDLALCRLAEDAPVEVEPLPMNFDALDQSLVGAEIRSVGFGADDGAAQTGAGTKRQVTYRITAIKYETIMAGDSVSNICQGDSGGPVFMDFGGTERVIAVHSFGAAGCQGDSESSRVDVYKDRFVQEVMDAWYGPCKLDGNCVTDGCTTPDPDCDVCGFDGECGTGCAKKDLDCPVGFYQGHLCSDREECEELLCIAAPEDERVEYCSAECDPTRPEDNYLCMPPLTACEDDGTGKYVCRFSGLTPSVQGAACDQGTDCRSGICDPEDGICVEPCGDGLPECPAEYACGEVSAGVDACVLPGEEAGCGCRTDGHGSSGGGWLLGMVLALLLARRKGAQRVPARTR